MATDTQVTRDKAKQQWINKGYSEDAFDKAYNDAAGSADTPNTDAWSNAMSSAYDKYGSFSSAMGGDWMSMMSETPGMDMESIMKAYKEISSMNWEKLIKQAWPEAWTAGFEGAGKVNKYLAEQGAYANEQDWAIAMQSNQKLAELMQVANQFYRGEASVSDQWAYGRAATTDKYMQGQVAQANEFNQEQLFAAYNKAMPGLLDTARNVKSKVDEMLAGEIPKDVQEQIQKMSAAMQLSGGLYGPAGGAATATSLGLSSLDITQRGMQYGMALPGMTKDLLPQQLLATPTTPDLVQNPTQFYQPFMPQPTYTKSVQDPWAYGQNFLQSAMNTQFMNPSQAIGSAQNAQQMALQNNQFNSQLQYSYGLSNLQNQWSWQNWETQWNQFNQQQATAKQGQWLGLAGSILGGAATVGAAAW